MILVACIVPSDRQTCKWFAAYRVGYHDASHFNREYKSLFGVPPRRDVHRLRAETPEYTE